MGKIITMGEVLVDFKIDNNGGYIKSAGGAPANVAACVAKLGGETQLITKLGKDVFGDYLVEELENSSVNTARIMRTNEAKTGLAFITHLKNGEQSFLFYRNLSADKLLNENEIDEKWFEQGDILHFCSLNLMDSVARNAHDKAIAIAWKKGCLICFDPNIRVSIYDDHIAYKEMVNRYLDYADILKINSEELYFITGIEDEQQAIRQLLSRVQMLVYTKGNKGALVYTKAYRVSHPGFEATLVDKTGAGDAFMGGFLYQLALNQVHGEYAVDKRKMTNILAFSNAVAKLVISNKGTINIMPTLDEVNHVCGEW